ncbi:MAG: hypothetical protein JWM31_1605, partial [Solirubrobacterales bacterium]|nr:hypothetical protein [Solirubrobacterales bacterium]
RDLVRQVPPPTGSAVDLEAEP